MSVLRGISVAVLYSVKLQYTVKAISTIGRRTCVNTQSKYIKDCDSEFNISFLPRLSSERPEGSSAVEYTAY